MSGDNNLPENDKTSKELSAALKVRLEENGDLTGVRAMLQSLMVDMMKNPKEPRPQNGGAGNRCMQMMDKLIMEVLKSQKLVHTAEAFAFESQTESEMPKRECLEAAVGPFEPKNRPILYQLVSEIMEKKNDNEEEKEKKKDNDEEKEQEEEEEDELEQEEEEQEEEEY